MGFRTTAHLGAGAVFSAALLFAAVHAGAVTWHVPGDPGAATVGQALDSAAAGDTVQVSCGLYAEHDLVMKAGVVLRSESGEPACVTIDAQGAGRVLTCANLDTFTVVEGLTLTGGQALGDWPADLGGAVSCLAASPKFLRCVVKNSVGGYGGGMYCGEGSAPRLIDCQFLDNTSRTCGGGLFAAEGTMLILTRCTLSGNVATQSGGGLYAVWGCSPYLTQCTFVGNDAPDGAAISSWLGSAAAVDRSLWAGNFGSAATIDGGSVPVLSCSVISANSGGDWTGPLASQLGTSGNLDAAPQFCSSQPAIDHHWALQSDSPCSPDHNECAAQIGAWPVGCGTTPVYLAEFVVTPSVDEVTIVWSILAGGGGADFRLLGRRGGEGPEEWEVPWHADGEGRFTAVDRSPLAAASQEITYALFAREDGGAWRLVATRQVTPVSVPAVVALHIPYPNPFNPRLVVPFTLPRAENVGLDVFDLAGRRVARLAAGSFAAGRHEVSWDGRDARGQPVATGAYFVRLVTDSFLGTRRVLLAR